MENHFIGLDIGKKNVDVAVPLGNGGFSCFRINNTQEGFQKFQTELEKRKADLKKKKMDVQFWLVSEATGIYYVPIHAFFSTIGVPFTVVNPLSISKFREEQLKINKTDKEDCKLISKYGFQNAVRLGSTPAPSMEIRKLTQLQVLRRCLQQNMQRLGGVMENLKFAKIEKNYADTFVEKAITDTKTEYLNTENKLIEVIKLVYPTEYKCLNSIKGVGNNLIIEIITETDCLKKFNNLKAFRSYCGVVASNHESGTSVYKKPKLAKTANRNLRSALYMSSLSASKANKECKELHDRLPEHLLPKQKLMHIANKLSVQIWFCVRNKEVYKPESQRKKAPQPNCRTTPQGGVKEAAMQEFKYKNSDLVASFESEKVA
jgi:transposase